jgi:hypothetical protein
VRIWELSKLAVPLFFEPIAVRADQSSVAMNPVYQDRLNAAKDFDEGHNDDYKTVSIGGRPHYIVIFPNQE